MVECPPKGQPPDTQGLDTYAIALINTARLDEDHYGPDSVKGRVIELLAVGTYRSQHRMQHQTVVCRSRHSTLFRRD